MTLASFGALLEASRRAGPSAGIVVAMVFGHPPIVLPALAGVGLLSA